PGSDEVGGIEVETMRTGPQCPALIIVRQFIAPPRYWYFAGSAALKTLSRRRIADQRRLTNAAAAVMVSAGLSIAPPMSTSPFLPPRLLKSLVLTAAPTAVALVGLAAGGWLAPWPALVAGGAAVAALVAILFVPLQHLDAIVAYLDRLTG